MQRYYKILELEFPATRDEVKRAFRRLAHLHHPDKGGDAERFKEISEAYHVLVQNGYWDVLAKEAVKKERPITKNDATEYEGVHYTDDGEFWYEDGNGFVTYYWTASREVLDASFHDDSSPSKDYVDLAQKDNLLRNKTI